MRSLTSTSMQGARRLALLSLIALSYCGTATAQNGTWTNTTDGQWENSANWQGGTIANGADNTADFSTLDIVDQGPPFYYVGVGMNNSRTIGHMIFGDTNPATPGAWEVYDTLGSEVTITLAGDNPSITVQPLGPIDTGTEILDDAIIRPILAGSDGLTKLGNGVLTIAPALAAHTITGGINVNEGTLRLQTDVPGQEINLGNNTTISVATTMDAATGHTFNVAPGNTATIVATAGLELGNFSAGGATLNLHVDTSAPVTITADGNWALNGSPEAMTMSSANGAFIRLRPNSGTPNFDTTNAFADAHLTLDNVTLWTRSNSFGNDVNIGALSGTSTAVIAGGAQGGGTAARYFIGSLNQDTEFAGSFDSTIDLPDPEAGLHIIKVGTGTLTLSGTVNNVPRAAGTSAATLPWRRGGVTQIQNGTIRLVDSTTIAGGVLDPEFGQLWTTIDVQENGSLDVTGFTAGTYATQSLQQIVGTGNIDGDWDHADGIIRPGNTVPDLGASTTITSADTTPVAGTITFNGDLSLNGGDIGYDMTLNPASGNDLIQVTGMTALNGGTIVPNFFEGIPATGTYTVLTSAGGFTGSASNISIDWPGRGTPPVPFVSGNNLQFTAAPGGASANLVWTGATNSNWDIQTTQNWNNNGSPDVFFNLDSVSFTEAAANKNVNVTTVVTPAGTITINNTSPYTFTGTGSIVGTAGLTKTGAGDLTMQVANGFSGPASVSGGGTIDIGTFGGALGTGALTLGGATLVGINGFALSNSSLVIADGTNNTIRVDGGTGSGNTVGLPNLSGGGTLTVTSEVADKWYALNGTADFTGTLNLTGVSGETNNTIRLTTASGGSTFPNAVVNLTGVTLANRQGGAAGTTTTFAFGELHGDAESFLSSFIGGGTAINANWEIGALNTNSDFAGTIVDASETSISSVTKVGSGTLALSGINTYTGDTFVQGGTLQITNPFLADESNVFIADGATLHLDFAGTDVINALYLDGIPQDPGLYGVGQMGAAFFAGSGLLQVNTLGPPLSIPGDFNGDGVVDAADYTVWRDGLGTTFTQGDYNLWTSNFGITTTGSGTSLGSSGHAAVPEPASLLLLVIGTAVLVPRAARKLHADRQH